ncbi:deoxyribodipyrimidine photo-lyase [soil metagenome]
MPSILWFRRDLRLADHPALCDAVAAAEEIVPLFVLDPALLGPAGAPRVAFMLECLRSLDADLGGALVLRTGDPADVLPAVAREVDATGVHVSADFNPYGRDRDERVAAALGDVPLVRTGSPYAVSPGRVTKADGEPYRVYTPFYRAWLEHGFPAPPARPLPIPTVTGLPSDPLPERPDLGATELPPAGEAAALRRWADFRDGPLRSYADDRNRPDLPATSRLSPYLRWGCLHPRTPLADLRRRTGKGAEVFRKELAWREFYADVLCHQPASARDHLQARYAGLRLDTGEDADARFAAWRGGRTGYPIVDAGMRQLTAEAWMHNRVRMIVASFLVKDLHIGWKEGARHFMRHLVDGDLASNQHGWQWVAGSGTDAAPFYRVFNPIKQGHDFDPAGDYVRRYVPELRGIDGPGVHTPWKLDDPPADYPERIVEHDAERREALERYQEIKD